MVVLAASICTHGGKALVLRQFRDIAKDRITALLANFPLLLSSSGSQNTTVEDDAVRYVYQPLEEYYVVLLTNKQLNILQDIDTLHLFVSVVSNTLRSVDEKEIFANAFEILSAFDEIVNLGYKEKLTMLQVQTFLEMDSHEEKIQEIIERNKELEASEERRRRAKEIQRKELARKNMEQQQAMFAPHAAAQQNAFGAYNQAPSTGPSYDTTRVETEPAQQYTQPAAAPRAAGRGLQLGKKPAKIAQPEQNQPLLTTKPVFTNAAPLAAAAGPAPAAAQEPRYAPVAVESALASPAPQLLLKPLNNGILITINEKVLAELSREGALVALEVKGDLQLRISDASLAHSRILLKVGAKPGIQYKTHPNVDRALFSAESAIGLKDRNKLFPSNDQSLGVLRWRVVAKDEDLSLVPLVLTAWVGINDGVAEVTLEYELTEAFVAAHPTQLTFDDVRILVPIALDEVELREDSTGQVLYDVTEEGVLFTVAHIALSEPLGLFEFSIPAEAEDLLFPMEVSFDTLRTEGVTEADAAFGEVLVVDVVSNDNDETSLPFDLHLSLVAEGYLVN